MHRRRQHTPDASQPDRAVDQDRIYFGGQSPDYSVVGTTGAEVDGPGEVNADAEATKNYEGAGGVPMGSTLRRPASPPPRGGSDVWSATVTRCRATHTRCPTLLPAHQRLRSGRQDQDLHQDRRVARGVQSSTALLAAAAGAGGSAASFAGWCSVSGRPCSRSPWACWPRTSSHWCGGSRPLRRPPARCLQRVRRPPHQCPPVHHQRQCLLGGRGPM